MNCHFCTELQLNPTLFAGQAAYTQHLYAKAFQLLSPLAYHGNIVAQCMLGSMFQLGLRVEQDIAMAKTWYLQAGCALSFHNLATLCSVEERNPALA